MTKQPKVEFVHIGDVFVDTGQVMVGDPAYLDDFAGSDNGARPEPTNAEFPYTYEGAASASLHGGGQLAVRPGIGSAVVTPTAHGDGIYPVFQVFEDGKLVALHVDLTMQLAN